MRMNNTLGWSGFGLVLATFAVGCGHSPSPTTASQPAGKTATKSCARQSKTAAVERIGGPGASSSVALVSSSGKTLAYVADEDDSTLHTVDIDTGKELAVTSLSGSPSHLVVTADGRVVVALRDRNRVEVLEPSSDATQSLGELCEVDVAAEPVAMATTPDDSTILVTSGWGHALTGLDSGTMARKYVVALPREPRAVVVDDDGKRAFVSHVVGSRMSTVDLMAQGRPAVVAVDLHGDDDALMHRQSKTSFMKAAMGEDDGSNQRAGCQGFALAKTVNPPGRIVAPQVLVDPGDTRVPTGGYGDGFAAAEVTSLAVIDAKTTRPLATSLKLNSTARGRGVDSRRECLLPRAAIASKDSSSVYVSCLGIDSVLEYDGSSADPRQAERRRWSVGSGPTGLAIDSSSTRLVVWSQFDQSLSVIPLDDAKDDKPTVLTLSRKAKSAAEGDLALGRKLFHAAGDPRIAADGRACASCHPDGRDDSLTWSTPEGPRNTPMLAGRLSSTGPFGWTGATDSVRDHVHNTFQRLRGSGLRGREMDALMAYTKGMKGPAANGATDARVSHGKQIFESAETACASCHHEDGTLTDGKVHDVQSRAQGDNGANFNTPSLRFLVGTAPYYHDGRYATLHDLLVGIDGSMGHTKHLSPDDLDALEAYLRSL
ncbi:MAG: cytochrome C peroxidase [Polyangiaceae bacterium]